MAVLHCSPADVDSGLNLDHTPYYTHHKEIHTLHYVHKAVHSQYSGKKIKKNINIYLKNNKNESQSRYKRDY
jgi:hypothetical protein